MDRIVEMNAFVAVAQAHSFSEAAKNLGVSPSSVTRSVSALETRLGARLLQRSTRSMHLTDAGRHFLDDARRILAQIEQAEQGASQSAMVTRGTLGVTAPVLFGEMFVQPVLREFLTLHPLLSAQLLLLDRVVNIVEEGIDIALRIGRFDDSSLQTVELGFVRRMLVAAPSYLARHGTPQTPADLSAHRITQSIGNNASPNWVFASGATTKAVRVEPALTVNTLRAAIDSAREGWAITRALSYQVQEDVLAGTLHPLLVEFEPPTLPVCLVFPSSRRPSAKLMAFVELASERIAARLSPPGLLRKR